MLSRAAVGGSMLSVDRLNEYARLGPVDRIGVEMRDTFDGPGEPAREPSTLSCTS